MEDHGDGNVSQTETADNELPSEAEKESTAPSLDASVVAHKKTYGIDSYGHEPNTESAAGNQSISEPPECIGDVAEENTAAVDEKETDADISGRSNMNVELRRVERFNKTQIVFFSFTFSMG